MEFIDTHTHIADEAFKGEEDAIIQRALEKGVKHLIQADIDSSERDAMFSIVDKYPGTLHAMLGLYPGSVTKDWEKEIELMLKWKDRDIVAIGEVGLDFHFSTEFVEEQKRALKVQFEIADKLNLPLNIHLRDATESFFEVLEECKHLGLHGNMHAYSGSYETFLRLQKYGDWSVGIGGVVTFKKASLAEVTKKIPLDKILLETDAPYLAPTPLRGTRNESSYIPIIAEKIAELKEISVEEVAERTTANAKALFGI